ncbi:hypothetical protein [Thermosyntropha sp.]|uniref:hypothetical protein n=1 Tax=Thermosyntropha sp. TaxID=2740820 RepID=UPI0025F516F1|nr:hypothetical protein [Thermosyntropha sp.]MBO8158952.1 hypothetical protein [Thermosyntropha sp.]
MTGSILYIIILLFMYALIIGALIIMIKTIYQKHKISQEILHNMEELIKLIKEK